MTPSITTQQTVAVQIAPKTLVSLRRQLKVYAELKSQRDAIDMAMKSSKATVEGILGETGESTLKVDGYTITMVAATRKKFDPKKFVALGGNLDLYNAANIEVAQKPYLKLSVPGDHDDE